MIIVMKSLMARVKNGMISLNMATAGNGRSYGIY